MVQYSKEIANDICERVANGDTLQVIADYYSISIGTVLNWVTKKDNAENYARAREAASDLFESKIIERIGSVTSESAAADRVAIDALKWVAARRSPKKYGDKVTQEVTGANGDPVSLLLTQVQGNSLGVSQSQSTADNDD